MRSEWEALSGNIKAIPKFLRAEQPEGSIIDHFGFSVHCGGMLSLEVAVCGWHGGPGGESGNADTCRVHVENKRHRSDEPKPEPLTEAEIDEMTAMIKKAGLKVKSQWGGGEWVSWGCTFPNINPSVKQARENYSEGCPEHHTVFCNGWQNSPYNEGCTYVSDHLHVAIPPAWANVAWPEFGGGDTSSIGDRNLEQVLDALARLKPIVEQLGLVPTTLTVGRRGRVENDEYVDEEGLGVILPAEAAERIAELLELAMKLGAL